MSKICFFMTAILLSVVFLFGQDYHWPLDEDYTDMVGSQHGVPSGSPSFVEDNERGMVLELNGDGSFVELPDLLFDDVSDATITCWFLYDGVANWERVWSFGYSDATETETPTVVQTIYLVPRDGNGDLHVTYQATGDWHDLVNSNPEDTITAGKWYFSTFVKEGTEIRFYLDGSLVPGCQATDVTENPGMLNDSMNYIGKSHWPDPTFSGKIDDLRIYKSALSESEIMEIYNTPAISVEDIAMQDKWMVYANNGRIVIKDLGQSMVLTEIMVFDLQGKKVFETHNKERLQRERFRSGLYLVRLKEEGFVQTAKVFIR